MLILIRERRQRIVIAPGTPDEVLVEVLEVVGNKVRLGITARPDMRIDREEVASRRSRHAADCPAAVHHPDDRLFPPGTFACTCGQDKTVRED